MNVFIVGLMVLIIAAYAQAGEKSDSSVSYEAAIFYSTDMQQPEFHIGNMSQ